MTVIGGYVIVNDVSVPHADYYRPAIRMKCRDGFCPIGPSVVPSALVGNPGALECAGFRRRSTAEFTRPPPISVSPIEQILSDVTEFMTLSPGDVLAVGVGFPPARVRAGQIARIEVENIGVLENPFIAEGAQP